ncbi:class I SAM-dependent methyltransferase [Phreatobacter stygius]|uniref:class I SAM-dependent methyltransferase n=1 Tax=Phreatobacter stygius TaxID=1940610 RepID=UPI00319E0A3F
MGCGAPGIERLHPVFRAAGRWQEVRLDVDPRVAPDIVCSTTDMQRAVQDASFDALWSSHNIEHLYDHEVTLAFAEFRRVLKRSGFALIRCPDLQAIIEAARTDGLESVAYVAPAGPVTPLDMLYGFRPSIARGNEFMAHKTGFTDLRLGRLLIEAGFAEVRTKRALFDLWAVAIVDPGRTDSVLAQLSTSGIEFDGA